MVRSLIRFENALGSISRKNIKSVNILKKKKRQIKEGEMELKAIVAL